MLPNDTSAPEIAAQNFFQLSIYDARSNHIVTLRLQRQQGMTIGDMAQLQNFFWVTLGQAVRSDEEMRRHLQHAGFEVLTEDPSVQMAPVNMN